MIYHPEVLNKLFIHAKEIFGPFNPTTWQQFRDWSNKKYDLLSKRMNEDFPDMEEEFTGTALACQLWIGTWDPSNPKNPLLNGKYNQERNRRAAYEAGFLTLEQVREIDRMSGCNTVLSLTAEGFRVGDYVHIRPGGSTIQILCDFVSYIIVMRQDLESKLNTSARRWLSRDKNDLAIPNVTNNPKFARTVVKHVPYGYYLNGHSSSNLKLIQVKQLCELIGLEYGKDVEVNLKPKHSLAVTFHQIIGRLARGPAAGISLSSSTEEIYKHFQLSSEEIRVIEDNVKDPHQFMVEIASRVPSLMS